MSDEEDYGDVDDEEQLDDEDEDPAETEEVPDFPLGAEMIGQNLSLLAKTGKGLAHAYVRLDIIEKQITDLTAIRDFKHVRYVDLTDNSLKELAPLSALTHLSTLKVESNLLTKCDLPPMNYLRLLNLTGNRITTMEGLQHPQLHTLNLNLNLIKEVTDIKDSLPMLDTLEIRRNELTSFKGIEGLPMLRKLFMAENQLTSLEGIDKVPTLMRLHVRDNPIESLSGITEKLELLQYLNIRDCVPLADLKEVAKLASLPALRALLMMGCPLADEPDYRIEVMSYVRALERLDKDKVEEDDRKGGEIRFMERREEQDAAAQEAKEKEELERGGL